MKRLEVIAAMQIVFGGERYSPRTAQCYIDWVNRFFRFSRTCSKVPLGDRVGQFLSSLNNRSAATQKQALCAMAFVCNQALERQVDFGRFARAQVPKRLPVWMTQDEIPRLFAEMRGVTLLMAEVGYGGGLRLREITNLRVKDVDLTQPVITVRQGKGNKDRTTCLPLNLIDKLRWWVDRLHALWEQDRVRGLAGVDLPDSLVTKYPNAGKEFAWQWFFPRKNPYHDPDRGGGSAPVSYRPKHAAKGDQTRGASGAHPQVRHGAYAAPFLRHAPARKGHRSSANTVIAGSQGHQHDDDLPALRGRFRCGRPLSLRHARRQNRAVRPVVFRIFTRAIPTAFPACGYRLTK